MSFPISVIMRTRLAHSPEMRAAERATYRRWVEHSCGLLEGLACWAAQLPGDSPDLKAQSVNVVMPELGAAAVRIMDMYPEQYAALNCATWQDFVLWCREHPRYDSEGNPISYDA